MDKLSKGEKFPLFFRTHRRAPSRSELFDTRRHLILMRDGLANSISPYDYMANIKSPPATDIRYIVADLNSDGESLWPTKLVTHIRIVCAKATLRRLSSKLHLILKDYP